MENDFSAIKSIQELKNLLDSGAITQQEYDVLKRKIIFGNTPNASASATGASRALVAPGSPANDLIFPLNPVNDRPTGPTPAKAPVSSAPEAAIPVNPGNQRTTNAFPGDTALNAVPENKESDFFKNQNDYAADVITKGKRKDWLLTILVTLAVILLLGLIVYQLFSKPDSEHLTSKNGGDTEEVTTNETVDAVAEPTPEIAVKEPTRPANKEETTKPDNLPAEANTPNPTVAPLAGNPEAAETKPPPSAPKISEEEALNKIKDRLQTYYNDIRSAPFSAQAHFAPTVDRYYTLLGTTPQAINENINSYHYSEFQDSESSIEEGSMKLINSGDNGYEVTYIEHGKAFRKSKGQKQETTARVRARLNKDFKLTFFRQEQLLENRFIEE